MSYNITPIIISHIHYGVGGGFKSVGAISKDPNFNYSEEFGTQKIGGEYYKFRLIGSEGINKIFGVGILENLLAAKSEGNCIKFVVSYFLIVIGDIIANYR